MISIRKEKGDKKPKKPRAWELDFFRGMAILLVVWDHTMVDFGYLFFSEWMGSGNKTLTGLQNFAFKYMDSPLRAFWRPIFIFIFFFVSGVCTKFSRNNFVRGLKIAAAALLVTLVTWLFELVFQMDDVIITFGVLHSLAACILIFALFEFLVKVVFKGKYKIPLFIVTAMLTAAAYVLQSVYNVPANGPGYLFAHGDYYAGFFVYTEAFRDTTADYFPLLPFIAYFLTGALVGQTVYYKKKSLLPRLDGKWNYFFTVPGRHSLLVYLGAQLIVVGVTVLMTYIVLGSVGI
jgi:Predicted membrane protein